MNPVREIITLQFGNYANYIGAHWWNIQEAGFNYNYEVEPSEICHDILYREGVNPNRQTTFTPRLLLVDLEGSLKHLSVEGELYGNSVKRSKEADENKEDLVKKIKEDLYIDDDIEVVEEPVVEKHEFQADLDKLEVDIEAKNYNLSQNVESWADYLYSRFHPRTINIVKNFKHNPESESFDTFSLGTSLWSTEYFQDDFCDKIRQYVEECDYLQGFQTIFDGSNGFAGLAIKCLEHLNDEYSKANFAIPVYSSKSVSFENTEEAMSDSIRVVNNALTFSEMIEQASLFVPLSTSDRVWRQLGSPRTFKNVTYEAENLYQTSSILASFLDTMTLRYRLKEGTISNTLSAFCADLTHYQRKMAAAAFSFPFPMNNNEDLIDCLDRIEGRLFTQLTPHCDIGTDYVTQVLCVRGIPQDRLKRPLEQARKQMQMAAYKCRNVSEMFQLYLQCSYHSSMAHVISVSQSLPTRTPFPTELFHEDLNTKGFIASPQKRSPADKIQSVPALASLQSSSKLGEVLNSLHRESSRVKISKMHRFIAAGLETDDYSEALEKLLMFNDKYEDNWEL